MAAASQDRPGPGLPALLALFFFSGFASLIYEVVWLRMLFRVFGSTSYATSNVLAVFMAGLAAGAGLAGRWSKRTGSPLAGYGVVELALALAGGLATWAAILLPQLVPRLPWPGLADTLPVLALRSGLSCATLFVPTLLMGASLPLLAEHCSRRRTPSPGGVWDRPALLYGVNTLGAVAGVLFPGFYAIGAWGELRTVAVAVGVNLAVGLGALLLARGDAGPETLLEKEKRPRPDGEPEAPPLAQRIGVLMAFSGFCALALEVLWTRLMILLLGNSIYAFSAMLASFLIGIGLGSLLAGRWLRSGREAGRAFCVLQLLAGLAAAATFELYYRHGLARLDSSYLYSPIHSAADLLRLFAVGVSIVLPVTLAYGMLFPVAAAVADSRGGGEAVGRVYSWNTVGAVLGSLACGFILIPALGTKGALYLLCAAQVALGLGAAVWGRYRDVRGLAGLALGIVALLAWLRPDPFFEIVQARLLKMGPGKVTFHKEGVSSTVTLYSGAKGESLILVNGIIVSGKGDLGRFMAHFPLILQAAPQRALVICLGAGNTFRAAVDHGVAVDLVELEPEVVAAFSALWPDHEAYLRHAGTRVIVNDGRNFLLTSRERYDAVIVDGTPPIYSAGTVNLYAREFVGLARRRLTPSGMLALWVPLPCFDSDFGMILRNFTDAFPHTLVWQQPRTNLPGVLLLGSQAPFDLDPKAVDRRARERGLAAANPWLSGGLLAPGRVIGDAKLRQIAAAYPLVTDDRPGTEFPLPRFLERAPLRRTPESLFR